MKTYKEKFPELYQYLGGLFHQDWKDVFDWQTQKPSFEGVVRYFKVRNIKCFEKAELNELGQFLSLGLSENEVEVIMDEWNIAYYPYGIKLTYIEWLKRILEILEEPMEETKKQFIPEFVGQKVMFLINFKGFIGTVKGWRFSELMMNFKKTFLIASLIFLLGGTVCGQFCYELPSLRSAPTAEQEHYAISWQIRFSTERKADSRTATNV